MQEPSALTAVTALDPQPGERVLDLCAAPGGKSTQIAALMAGRGLLCCNEPIPSRAQILSRNIERMGVRNAVMLSAMPDALAPRFPAFFDRILVDAPCSGEGMFRRQPEARDEWDADAPRRCADRQMEILAQASQKPAACLDWNNNYGDDENKCILFHCGSTAQGLMEDKGVVGVHKMFAKGNGPDYGWGVNEGRIAAMPMTYASARTENGLIYTYVDEGRMTGEPIEKEYFGCAGVAEISDLQKKIIYMGRNGFRHHTTISAGHYADAIEEAMKTYLGYEVKRL